MTLSVGRDTSGFTAILPLAVSRLAAASKGGLIPFALAVVLSLAAGCERSSDSPPATDFAQAAEVVFVGGQACAGCHADEALSWTGSHHDGAMQPARPDTVLGDFDNAEFSYNGVTSVLFERDGEFGMATDGPSGALEEYRVTHTFGIEPLQQYLLELPDGRHQASSIAWDTRPAQLGGQRWFHLYPDDAVDHEDPLHWTGVFQSWNTMCAECHSTNLEKNYSADPQSFATTWSSIDVDCEACHGPGSAHVASPEQVSLALPAAARAWVMDEATGIAARSTPLDSAAEIEVCAQCHSRRAQLSDEFLPGQPLLDGFRPALLDEGLYHADGQILDEVYVYGSFLQSAMHAAGVTCSDCHDPHSTGLRANGNAVCGTCHLASTFESPRHHNHREDSAPDCVDCHMRAEIYMVVDPRRDHSFRVPRPDLSVRIGVPNACNDCHRDETAAWAAEQVAGWFPDGRHSEFHYGEAIQAGRAWQADRVPLLERVVTDAQTPAIARATAVSLLGNQLDDTVLDLVGLALLDDDPIVQLAALDVVPGVPENLRIDFAQRLLDAPLRALRSSAARALATLRPRLSARRQQDLDAALEDHIAVQMFNADRAQGHFNLGSLFDDLGQPGDAEQSYLEAIEREPGFAASYINLADLYRRTGREDEALQLLGNALAMIPEDAGLPFALGLSLVRSGRQTEALEFIERAAELAPASPYYAYALGVALNSAGESERALAVLGDAHEQFPGYREILLALATMYRDGGEIEVALVYTRRLIELWPADPDARSLLAELPSLDRSRP
ncbi:tetratricopeptide repeat protein [Candidatus Rariloculus sp.]|uniref:tetratricopeptide repeat protein n=1 Tax=Candidatus Rariloculus sp. TaxID=3101265 RepID=UPI003D0ED940